MCLYSQSVQLYNLHSVFLVCRENHSVYCIVDLLMTFHLDLDAQICGTSKNRKYKQAKVF